MNIAITPPDDVAEKLEQHWSDLPRHILESLVADLDGVGLPEMGHGDIATTRPYLNIDDDSKQAALDRLMALVA